MKKPLWRFFVIDKCCLTLSPSRRVFRKRCRGAVAATPLTTQETTQETAQETTQKMLWSKAMSIGSDWFICTRLT